MEFRTNVSMPRPVFNFSYQDRVLLMGSCFTTNIGVRFIEDKFSTCLNPFGVLYNPASISQAIRRLIEPREFTHNDLILHEGLYHSFWHHSDFSSENKDEALDMMNRQMYESAKALHEVDRLVITFGTAFVYRLASTGMVVANCHKLPEKEFIRERLSVDDIVNDWEPLLLSLWEQNPNLKLLFTVSPIRHLKDGAHENQLSKATLLLAIDRLKKQHADRIDYFPAYEIVLDELRDYRFYAEDMLHPSTVAINYIWEAFSEQYFTDETKATHKEWQKIKKAIEHRPFQPKSESYYAFISQTLLKLEQLKQKYPYFEVAEEIKYLEQRIKER